MFLDLTWVLQGPVLLFFLFFFLFFFFVCLFVVVVVLGGCVRCIRRDLSNAVARLTLPVLISRS